jgi:hypothetical protein
MKIRKEKKVKVAIRPQPSSRWEILDNQEWDVFFDAWWATYEKTRVRVRDLLEIVHRLRVPAKIHSKPTEHSQITALGMAINNKWEFRVRSLGKSQDGAAWYRIESPVGVQ